MKYDPKEQEQQQQHQTYAWTCSLQAVIYFRNNNNNNTCIENPFLPRCLLGNHSGPVFTKLLESGSS